MRQSLLLPLLLIVLLGSCESEDKTQVESHVIDSTVNARVRQHNAELSARNDSILKAVEMSKADEITRRKAAAAPATSAARDSSNMHQDSILRPQ